MTDSSRNPFSRHLLEAIPDAGLRAFVAQWDALERLFIEIYRRRALDLRAARRHETLRRDLLKAYPQWQAHLAPFWKSSQSEVAPPHQDPFEQLLTIENPENIIGNWEVLKTLPTAREAINLYLNSLLPGE